MERIMNQKMSFVNIPGVNALLTLPVPLPLPANRMRQRKVERSVAKLAVVFPPMIFGPSCVRRVLMQMLRANVVVLAANHQAQAN